MAGKTLTLAIQIGGYLSSQLTTSLKNTTTALKSLGSSGERAVSKLDALRKFEAHQKSLSIQTEKLGKAYSRLADATYRQGNYSGGNANKQAQLNRKQQEAQATVARLLRETQNLSKGTLEYKNLVERTCGSIGSLIKQKDNLIKIDDKVKKAQKRQEKIEKTNDYRANLLMRADYSMRSARAIAETFRAPLQAAMQAETMAFELKTVINVPEKYKAEALKKAQKTGAMLAKAGYATFAETQEAQYALNSAGLTAALSRSAVKTVASVSKVTKGSLGQVGEVLATA